MLFFILQTVILNLDLFGSFQGIFEELLVASHYICKIFVTFLQLYNVKISFGSKSYCGDLKGDTIGE